MYVINILIYIYIIAQKIIGKSGSIAIDIYSNELIVNISSERTINTINESELEKNSVNALLLFAFNNCKKITNNKIKQQKTGNSILISLEVPQFVGNK